MRRCCRGRLATEQSCSRAWRCGSQRGGPVSLQKPWYSSWLQTRLAPDHMASKATTGAKRTRTAKKPPKWVLHELWLEQHGDEYRARLWRNLNDQLSKLEALKAEAKAQWPPERVFPFDSRSFETDYALQPVIQKIGGALQDLLPDRPVRNHFSKVIASGTGHAFDCSDPVKRAKVAPIIAQSFGIAYFYLTMACDVGRAGKVPVKTSHHPWRALQFLFELSPP
jgi:hypothetical protein